MKISILVPSRNRPQDLLRLVKSAAETMSGYNELEFLVYIDLDEPQKANYVTTQSLLQYRFDGTYKEEEKRALTIELIPGPRIVLSEMWNRLAVEATGDILMHCGDDIRFKTVNWDLKVVEKFKEVPDQIAFVYGNDLLQPESFGTHGFISRRAMEAVGYFVPPYFSSDYNDTWWNEVYASIGRHFYIPIITEHMHPDAGKHEEDLTHQERRARGNRDNVHQLYADKLPERLADAQKLREAINNFK